MSDLYETREKVESGADWRGEITVTVDGEQQSLTVRQLNDTEFWDVMSSIDIDEIESMQSSVDDELLEEFEQLQSKDELTDSESDRLEELEEQIDTDEFNVFEHMSKETYEGIKDAAKYAVEPDEEDIQHALVNESATIKRLYGDDNRENAIQYINDSVIAPMIDDSTDFTSFEIGITAFMETLDDEGN